MKPLVSTFLDGLRAVFLRHPRGRAITAGPGVFVALVVVYLVVALALAAFDTAAPRHFDPAGVTTVLADSLLTLLAAWLLAALAGRHGIAWGVAALLLAATVAIAVIVQWPLMHASVILLHRGDIQAAALIELVSRLWWFPVLLVVAHWLKPRGLGHALFAATLAYAVCAAPWWWLPQASLLTTHIPIGTATGDGQDNATHTPPEDTGQPVDDDSADEAAQPEFDAEQVMYDQPALLDAALANLAPQRPGRIDLYVVAFAGDAQEDVFRNEAEYAQHLFTQRFDAAGHVLVLENNAASVTTRPLATWTNLHRALDAIAKKMDPAEDILLVYLTTHGSAGHQLLVDLDPLPLDQIEPDDLADALKTTPGVRWKVVIVNACYSGGFVDALHDDSTMVMTSARADRTSFGCGADSDITWFGKAFLAEALNQTTSLREAFDLAKKSVATWEHAGKEQASEPQIASSPSIEAKLDAWQKQLLPGAAVPFAPAATAAGDE